MDLGLFYLLAVLSVASAIAVVGQRNPTYSAFALIVTLCSLSGIYGLMGSPFIATLQIVVYAGAIMVLFLFVLMLLNVRREAAEEGGGRALRAVAVALVGLFALEVGMVLARLEVRRGPAPGFDASTRRMAETLFSLPFLYVFEATSILILAALVGAVVLAKKEP